MRHIKWLILPIALNFAACDQSYNKTEADLIRHVKENKLGGVQSYWLEKNSIQDYWSKVILIFGFPRNQDACLQLIEQQRNLHPEDRAGYRCVAAN
jgi:hypothetical protein